jgi:hypothetical protein
MTVSKQSQDGKHVEFYDRINLDNSASGWLFKKKSITMHGNVNVKLSVLFRYLKCTPITSVCELSGAPATVILKIMDGELSYATNMTFQTVLCRLLSSVRNSAHLF